MPQTVEEYKVFFHHSWIRNGLCNGYFLDGVFNVRLGEWYDEGSIVDEWYDNYDDYVSYKGII